MNRIYVAICQNYWGTGTTPKMAKEKARKAGAWIRINAPGKWLVKLMPVGAVQVYVNHMGDILWTWADDAPDRNAKTEIIEKPTKD